MCKKNILQTIFSDHFEYVQYIIRPGKNIMDNIDRMIHCHDPSFRALSLAVLIVATLNLFLFPVKAGSVLLVAKSEHFTPWRPNTHFDYNFLRLAFRKVLLDQLSLKLRPSFKKLKNQIFKDHPAHIIAFIGDNSVL